MKSIWEISGVYRETFLYRNVSILGQKEKEATDIRFPQLEFNAGRYSASVNFRSEFKAGRASEQTLLFAYQRPLSSWSRIIHIKIKDGTEVPPGIRELFFNGKPLLT
jgi:hypothetical protein